MKLGRGKTCPRKEALTEYVFSVGEGWNKDDENYLTMWVFVIPLTNYSFQVASCQLLGFTWFTHTH